MNEIINSNAVSAGAAVASALATIVTAFIAHWAIRAQEKQTTEAIQAQKEQTTEAIRVQEKQTRWLTQMDLLLRTHERFNSQDIRQLRKEVAEEYLRTCRNISRSYPENVYRGKISSVLSYFDFVGRQVENKALDREAVRASFAFWVTRYFRAFGGFINDSREKEGGRLWDGAVDLYKLCGGDVECINSKRTVKKPEMKDAEIYSFFELESFL